MGRRSELALLKRLLRPESARVAVSGLAGSGKSELAAAAARQLAGDVDVVAWLSGRIEAEMIAGLVALGADLGLPVGDAFGGVHDKTRDRRLIVLQRWLRDSRSWLLVFDDVTEAGNISGLVPLDAPGKVLATAVTPSWPSTWTPVSLGSMPRSDAVGLMRSRGADDVVTGRLLQVLRGLPLALIMVAAHLAETRSTADTYLDGLDQIRRGYALEPAVNPARLVALASLDRLATLAHPAVELLALLAQYAPRDIPAELLPGLDHEAFLPSGLAALSDRESAENALVHWSLVRRTGRGLFVHGEVQAAARQYLTRRGKAAAWAATAVRVADTAMPEEFDLSSDRLLGNILVPHVSRTASRAVRAGVEPEAAAAVLRRVGTYWLEVGAADEAVRVVRLAASVANHVPDLEHGRTLLELGRALYSSGDTAGARAELGRGLELLADRPDAAGAKAEAVLANELGAVALQEGNIDECLRLQKHALEILNSRAPEDSYAAAVLNDIAHAMESILSERETAATYYDAALARFEAECGSSHPWVATVSGNYARLLSNLGRHRDARRAAERALEIDRNQYGPNHDKVAIRYNNLAPILQDLGSNAEAHTCLERAVRIWKDLFGPRHPNIAAAESNLGRLLIEDGQNEVAVRVLCEAISVWQGAFPAGHLEEAVTHYHLARAYRNLQEHDLARAAASRSLEIETAVLGSDAPDLVSTLVLMADIEIDAGSAQSANSLLDRARSIGAAHPNRAHLAGSVDRARRRLSLMSQETHAASP